MKKIDKKIVGFTVKTDKALDPSSPPIAALPEEVQKTEMNETIERPDVLIGSTYKIAKSPSSEHALYVTINDILLDEGTEHERRRPFEIFINSKNMDQFQWIVAMTRIMSAVFRKGGDVTFLVDEMKAVFDPHGGYFRKGGYVPSIIAEIGGVIESHLKGLGIIESQMDDATRALIEEKRKAYEGASKQSQKTSTDAPDSPRFPPSATMCNKCHDKAVVIMDGCATCLSCGNSKCG